MNRNIRSSQNSTLSKLLAKEKKHSSRDVSDETEKKKISEKMLMIVSKEAALDTVCGGYNGDDFVSAGEYSVVKGNLNINGVGNLDANYLFNSIRIDDCYWELLTVTTEKGGLEAVAFYEDAPLTDADASSTLSSSPSADYMVLTSCGELRETKGHMFRIHFNNKSPNRPRKVEIVPWVGANKVYAQILAAKKNKEDSIKKYTYTSDDFGSQDYDVSKPDIVSGEFLVPVTDNHGKKAGQISWQSLAPKASASEEWLVHETATLSLGTGHNSPTWIGAALSKAKGGYYDENKDYNFHMIGEDHPDYEKELDITIRKVDKKIREITIKSHDEAHKKK